MASYSGKWSHEADLLNLTNNNSANDHRKESNIVLPVSNLSPQIIGYKKKVYLKKINIEQKQKTSKEMMRLYIRNFHNNKG